MGDKKEQFGRVYDQCIDKIYRFVFLKVSSAEVAEDLTSEAFVRYWECFNSGQNIDNPRAFLYQIARNLVIDHYREKGRAQFVSMDNISMADPVNLEEKAILSSDIKAVRQSLAGLKEDYQNVIIWHYLDELTIPEIAKMMGRSEEAARVLLHRALGSLRSKIKEI